MLLSDYIQAARRGWIIILVTMVLALGAAAGLIIRKADVYSATTQLFVTSAVPTKSPEEQYQRNLIATQRVASYVSVVRGDVVVDQVSEVLGSEIDASIDVSIIPETVILQITASGADADEVADVARAYAEVVPGVIDEIEHLDGVPTQVRVTVVDEAEVPTSPDSSSPLLTLIAAGILGLGLAFTIVMVREALRRERAEGARTGNLPTEAGA